MISNEAKIINSNVGTENVKIFDNAVIKNSNIDNYAIIGDSAIITDSQIQRSCSINRHNHILKSTIGKFTYTAERTKVLNADIGNFCSIAWQVSVGGGKHNYEGLTTHPLWRFKMLDQGNLDHNSNIQLKDRYKTITRCHVGHDVWIAPNVIIVTDIKIGNGAVIGAGAVVTKDVEPYSIVAGVPAKKIKMRFDDKIIEALEEIKWWDWPIEVIRENLDLIYSKKVDEQVIEKLKEISNSLK